MVILGKVFECYQSHPTHQHKIVVNSLEVDFGGVIGDKFFKKDSSREILITSVKSYEFASINGYKLNKGDLGENILVDFDIKYLDLNQQLYIGNSILKVVLQCPICKSLTKIDSKFPKLIKQERGFFVKVIRKGSIKKDDIVYLYNN